jgi:hypothetical protein
MSTGMREEIQIAIESHASWVARLRAAIEGPESGAIGSEFALPKVGADDQCGFGRWLFGETLPEQVRASEHYQQVRRLHAAFHSAAGDALGLSLAGMRVAALEAVGPSGRFALLSRELVGALESWKAAL